MTTRPSERICSKCKNPMSMHRWETDGFKTPVCPIPIDAPLPEVPPGFKSKVRLYNLFKQCEKCHVKKYVNRESNLCLACEGMP